MKPAKPLLALALAGAACRPHPLHRQVAQDAPAAPDMYVAAAAAPKCAAPSDARQLVPADATAMVGVDVAAFRRSSLFADAEAMLRAQSPTRDVVEAAERCGIGLGAWERMTAGVSETGDAVVVLQATGLGRDASLDCVAKEIEAQIGTSPWRRRPATCGSELDMPGATGAGWAVGEDTVVLVSHGWEAKVDDLRRGKGSSARKGKLSWAFGAVDATDPIWFAADVPRVAAAGLGSGWGSMADGLRNVGGSIDLASGIDLQVAATFDRAPQADVAARALSDHIGKLALIGPMLGLPSGVAAGLGATAHGTQLDAHATISQRDLEALQRWVAGTLGTPSRPATAPSRPGGSSAI